jgi:NAD(P)H-dependent flavin oxidoreductase YrpB (nitropropane dioxygenase family)
MGTAFMATQECQITDQWKRLIAEQDITDSKYHRKIFHMEGRETALHSMASAMIADIPTVSERVHIVMNQACDVIDQLKNCTGELEKS